MEELKAFILQIKEILKFSPERTVEILFRNDKDSIELEDLKRIDIGMNNLKVTVSIPVGKHSDVIGQFTLMDLPPSGSSCWCAQMYIRSAFVKHDLEDVMTKLMIFVASYCNFEYVFVDSNAFSAFDSNALVQNNFSRLINSKLNTVVFYSNLNTL